MYLLNKHIFMQICLIRSYLFWHVYQRTTKTGHYKPHQTFANIYINNEEQQVWERKKEIASDERDRKQQSTSENWNFAHLFLSFSCDYFKHHIFIVCSRHNFSTSSVFVWVYLCVYMCAWLLRLLFHYSNLNFFDWILLCVPSPKTNYKMKWTSWR